MSIDFHRRSATELMTALDSGECSSVELTGHFLKRIERLDSALNSFISVCGEQAMTAAKAADAARSAGEAGPLCGLPIAHKDNLCTAGVKTSCASKMLDNFIAPYDATIVGKLQAAGAVMIGKTNMDEFAMGASSETSWYGPTRNPWDLSRVPGGSSGGSSAAVAAGLTPLATASDTGGSIRQPAAFCGISGIKPTYGRVSRYGMIAFASSLDQAGSMGRTVADTALMLQHMAGFDPMDSTSVAIAVPDFSAALEQPVRGLRIGLPSEYFSDKLAPEIADVVHAALSELEKQGATLVEISLPNTALAVPCYYVIAPAEASTNLSRFDGVRYGYRCENPQDLEDLYTRTRAEGFGDEVKRRILIGTYALSAGFFDAYYNKAQRIRRLICEDFEAAFQRVDIIAAPVTPSTAFPIGDKVSDPVEMYLQDVFTIAANLAGLPALALPVAPAGGLPVGMQFIGKAFDESTLFRAGHQLQLATDWHTAQPEDAS